MIAILGRLRVIPDLRLCVQRRGGTLLLQPVLVAQEPPTDLTTTSLAFRATTTHVPSHSSVLNTNMALNLRLCPAPRAQP
jgi:hypothetical protein